jgi:hypothetical protein
MLHHLHANMRAHATVALLSAALRLANTHAHTHMSPLHSVAAPACWAKGYCDVSWDDNLLFANLFHELTEEAGCTWASRKWVKSEVKFECLVLLLHVAVLCVVYVWL